MENLIDREELRAIFLGLVAAYDKTDLPNEVRDFQYWAIHKLHTLMRENNAIDYRQFGILVDMVICY